MHIKFSNSFVNLNNSFLLRDRAKNCIVFQCSNNNLCNIINHIDRLNVSVENVIHFSGVKFRKESVLFELSDIKDLEAVNSIGKNQTFFSKVIDEPSGNESSKFPRIPWKTIRNCYKDPLEIIKKSKNHKNGFKELAKIFALRPEENLLRMTYTMSLERLIQSQFPDTETDIYGSTCYGFSTLFSDLDIILNLKTDQDRLIENMNQIKKLIRENDSKNVSFISIYKGKFPIINLRHNLVGSYIDISIKNDIEFKEMQKSMLFYSNYFSSYQGFQELMIIVKAMFRKYNILKEGPARYFTSFKITVLLVHFLQTIDLIEPMKFDLIKPRKFNQSLDSIFLEFLKWIQKSDFTDIFIDLYEGRSFNKTELKVNDYSKYGDYLICPEPFCESQKNITKYIDLNAWRELQSVSIDMMHDLKIS